MNWINSVVRPKIRSILRKKEMPDNLWVKCPETGQMIYYKDLEANQFVVPGSNYHMRMSAAARLKSLFDGGEYETVPLPEVPLDPLEIPRRAPLYRPAEGRPQQDRPRRCGAGRRGRSKARRSWPPRRISISWAARSAPARAKR